MSFQSSSFPLSVCPPKPPTQRSAHHHLSMLLQASFYSSNRIINIPCSCYRPVSLPTFTGCATAAYRETQRRTHSTRGESGVKKQWNERPDFIHLSIRLLNGRSCSHDDDGDVMRVEEKQTHCCCCWYFADPREFSHKFQSLSDTLSTCCTTICNNVPNRWLLSAMECSLAPTFGIIDGSDFATRIYLSIPRRFRIRVSNGGGFDVERNNICSSEILC